MRILLTCLCFMCGLSFTSTAVAHDDERDCGRVLMPLDDLDGKYHSKHRRYPVYPGGAVYLNLPCRDDDDKDDEEPVYAAPEFNNPIDQKCNVTAYRGIREACYAFNNPPIHIQGMKVDAKDACYNVGAAIYDDILGMSKNVPTDAVAAYEDAAQYALKAAYYNCKNGRPGFTTVQFLQRMASPF